MDDPPSFQRMLRERRKARDLTQEALAEQVSCSVETIRKIEAGKLRPGKPLAELLADRLTTTSEDRAAFLKSARAELAVGQLALPPLPGNLEPPNDPTRASDRQGPRELVVSLPSGTLTFLFTDIEGSTPLWEQHREAMHYALIRHDTIVHNAIEAHNGVVFKTTGDGVHAAFTHATGALLAALVAQRALHTEDWGVLGTLRVRIALHTGVAEERDGDYFGPPLNRVARLLAAGYGDQILLSRATEELVHDRLPPGTTLCDLGNHRLKGLTRSEQIFQLVAPDLPASFPPLITAAVVPQPPEPASGASRGARSATLPAPRDRNRSRIVAKVREFWVKGVLENSLHGAALIALGLERQPDAVAYPWTMVVQQSEHGRQVLPPDTSITAVFDILDGELLILGAPGAGKTTLLLELTRDLLVRAEQDVEHPLPIVFNLSSWSARRRPLVEWLIDELNMRYDVPRRIGQAWVESDQILPLLDGLDEVQPGHRAACVDAINAFRRDHGLANLVVCSRIADYETLTTRLKLQGAVLVQSLTPGQIDAYLAQAGPTMAAVRTALREDAALQKLAETPLMLSIITLAYQGITVESLQALDTLERRRTHLFTTYVQRMLERRGRAQPYTPQHVLQWLAWLARVMNQDGLTIFFIEGLQPEWLARGKQQRFYAGGEGLALGLVAGFIAGLGNGLARAVDYRRGSLLDDLFVGLAATLAAGLAAALIGGLVGIVLVTEPITRQSAWRSALKALWLGATVGVAAGVAVGLSWDLLSGLAYGLVVGLTSGLAFGLVAKAGKITVVETLSWSRPKVRLGLAGGALIGVVASLVFWLASRLAGESAPGLAGGLVSGLAVGLGCVVVLVLAIGLTGSEIETKTVPNQGIWRSAHSAIRVGLISGLAIGLAAVLSFGLTLSWIDGLSYGASSATIGGLIVGLMYGGAACIQHVVLRLVLYLNGDMPLNYARFLDSAAERIFLRKVGGGYIFMHRLLLEYFAAQSTRSSTTAPRDPKSTE
jgi:class 3 adenylate cyclase